MHSHHFNGSTKETMLAIKQPAAYQTLSYCDYVNQLCENNNEHKFNDKVQAFLSGYNPKSNNSSNNYNVDFFHNNLVIGEEHTESAAKNFLINNMKLLKDKGFTTLFIEGLSYENQDHLDHFSQDETNPAYARLKTIDKHYNYKNDSGYTALVTAAKAHGIKIVGLETDFTLQAIRAANFNSSQGKKYRLETFSFLASHIIDRETNNDSKWVMLSGIQHLKTTNDVPGIANLKKAHTMIVRDKKSSSINQVKFNQEYQPVPGQFQNVDAQIEIGKNNVVPSLATLTPTITKQQFENALEAYKIYKSKFCGLRWLFTSKETKEVIKNLEKANDDKHRFSIFNRYVSKNHDRTFAKKLNDVLWSKQKIG